MRKAKERFTQKKENTIWNNESIKEKKKKSTNEI
jgi:hypothetical protein